MPPKKNTAPTTPTTETPTATTSTNQEAQVTGQATIVELPPSPPPWVDKLASQFWRSTTRWPGCSNHTAIQKPVIPEEVHELDVFDGSNTHKLQPFLVKCTLNFHNHPDTFISDSDKVTFTLSYLKGTVLDWFKLLLTSGKSLPWLDDYSDFIGELKNNFGPHNPKGDLENLKMCDNQCIVKYLIDFNCLAAHVQWGDATLCWQLYCGLPSCIKNKIACVGKPNTLYELHSLIQSIDSQYWERCSEVAWENLTTNKNEHSSDKGKGNEETNTTQNANENKSNNGRKSNSGNSSNANTGSSNTNQKKPNSNLSSKLGKDSKLMQAERQCDFEQNLCLFCSKTGHIAKECSKVTSSTTATDKNSNTKSSMESKNLWAVLNTPHWLRTVFNSLVHLWSHD